MKVLRHSERARDRLLHIEATGCIVNVRTGLHDTEGRPVTSVQILPDPGWTLDGSRVIGPKP